MDHLGQNPLKDSTYLGWAPLHYLCNARTVLSYLS